MKGNETYISNGNQALLSQFSRKNNVAVWMSRNSEPISSPLDAHEHPAKESAWRITIDTSHSLVVQSEQFPDHLVGELVDLAEGLKRGLYAMGD